MNADQGSILIKNCLVLQAKNPPKNYRFEPLDVLIDGWGILSIGKGFTQGTEIIDGGHQHVLIPAFVDNHIHSRQVGRTKDFKWGDPASLPKTEDECRQVLEAAYCEAASAGTAILMDYPEYMFNPNPSKDGFNLPFECMADFGLTGVVRVLLSHDKPRVSGYEGATNMQEMIDTDVTRIEQILEKHDGFEVAVWIPEESKMNNIDDFSNPKKPRYEIDKIISYLQGLYSEFRDNERIYFVMHCAETMDRTNHIKEFCYRNGIDFLQRNNLLGRRTVLVHVRYDIQQQDVDTVKNTGAKVVVRPRAKEYGGRVHKCPVQTFLDNEVVVGLGTDVPTSTTKRRFTVISEIQEAMKIYGIDFKTAFYMATEMGAKVFGFDKTGRIQPGYAANLVMLDAGKRLDQAYSIGDLEKHLTGDSIKYTFLATRLQKSNKS